MKKIVLLLFVVSSLQGCFGKRNPIKEDVVFKQSVPVCSSEEVCSAMWKAAEEWVVKYSPQGIAKLNAELIQSEEREVGSFEMEIVVRKIKQEDGSYKILIDNVCSRKMGGCTEERENMIAFNKKLLELAPAEKQQAKIKVFEDHQDIKQWLETYLIFVNKFDASLLSAQFHFPVTLIEEEKIIVLNNETEVAAYLKEIQAIFQKFKAVYLKTNSIDVFERVGNNVYINVEFSLMDAESASAAAWQSAMHLTRIDGKWKLISSAMHTK